MNLFWKTRYRLLLSALVFAFLLLSLWAYLPTVAYRYMLGTEGFIENKHSKLALMETRDEIDVVFVGSSKTQNHINTEVATMYGFSAFNLGLAGRMLQEYPYLVKKAAKKAKTAVVISFPATDFRSRIPCPDKELATFFDYYFFFQHNNFGCEMKSYYQRFLYLMNPNTKSFIRKKRESTSSQQRSIAFIQKEYGYDLRKDPRGINFIRGAGKRKVVVYQNGDGQVFARLSDDNNNAETYQQLIKGEAERKRVDFSGKTFSKQTVTFVQELCSVIASEGVLPIIVLEPFRYDTLHIVEDDLLADTCSEGIVINKAAMEINPELWADFGHLGPKGTEIYSHALYQDLVKELKRSSH